MKGDINNKTDKGKSVRLKSNNDQLGENASEEIKSEKYDNSMNRKKK